MDSTVALRTVTIAVAMVVTTLWSVRLQLPRGYIAGMLTLLALTWALFTVLEPTPLGGPMH